MDLFTKWYGFLYEQKNSFAETIYHRFLERLDTYTEGRLPDEIKREHVLRYLLPSVHLLKSPFVFPDMARAVSLIREHAPEKSSDSGFLQNSAKKIVIYGDRDADGVTSAALLTLFCREQLGITAQNLTTLVPREDDKYGIVGGVVQRIIDMKPDLLITLDCGSSNRNELQQIRQATGCKTIIIDHHFIPPDPNDFPDVEAFINPKRLAESEFARDYCTAAIVLRFVQAILFSYTRNFDQEIYLHTAQGEIYLKNGVQIPKKDLHQIQKHYSLRVKSPISNECHDLEKIFAHTARENFSMQRLFHFFQKAPDAFSPVEIFNAVESASYRKVHAILAPYIPLASIGLVADLMPIYADNRILVREGLDVITRQLDTLPIGLVALIKKLNLASSIQEQDLGFSLCPVINAAGRMGNAALALDALVEKDPLNAAKAAHALIQTNDARKEASQAALTLLDDALDSRSTHSPIAVAVHAHFHRGISGLIASKIAEKLGKPSVVMVPDGDTYRGSVRAYKNENVYSLLESLSAHLIQFGGHKQAAGFSVAEENVPAFIDAVFAKASALYGKAESNGDGMMIDPFRSFDPPLEIDISRLRTALWNELLTHAPYGVINPHPIVSILEAGKVEISPLGKTGAHAKIKFAPPADASIEGVWFFHGGAAESIATRENLIVSGEPQVGKFMGRVQYRLKITKIS
ncbi:MAG TPA: DHH family phosphoesterase [Turneriella sp.]|nr:DHH family phosphoesterase [Turneriella sp.]